MNSNQNLTQSPQTGGVRFAPSPTGRFHIGNLRTAWVSHLFATTLKVPWVVRFEDIDRPRVLAGARESQLEDMKALGLTPDVLLLQSDFHRHHWELFKKAIREEQVYPCDCSRKDVQTALAGIASAPHDGKAPVYSGRCRSLACDRSFQASETLAWRFKMPAESGVDDFIVARTGKQLTPEGFPEFESFVPSYHWACAIDDFDGAYDLLVRSADLASAAPLQRAIAKWLDPFRPSIPVFHTSLVTQNDGHRLEKRTLGVTLPELKTIGIAEAALIERFEASFERSLLLTKIESEALYSEQAQSLKLHLLGL